MLPGCQLFSSGFWPLKTTKISSIGQRNWISEGRSIITICKIRNTYTKKCEYWTRCIERGRKHGSQIICLLSLVKLTSSANVIDLLRLQSCYQSWPWTFPTITRSKPDVLFLHLWGTCHCFHFEHAYATKTPSSAIRTSYKYKHNAYSLMTISQYL